MIKLIITILFSILLFNPSTFAQKSTASTNPYGQIIWEVYPKPWNYYPHNILVDSTLKINNEINYPKILCRVIITEYHLPNDYPSIYHFIFSSPSFPSWHFEIIDTSVEAYKDFSFEDLNFDGYNDLRYHVSPKIRCAYPGWIFDRKLMVFQYNPNYDCLPKELDLKNKVIFSSGYSFSAGIRYDWSSKDSIINNNIRTIEESNNTEYSAKEKFGNPDSSDRNIDYYKYKIVKDSIQMIQHKKVKERLRNNYWYTTEIIEKLVEGKLKIVSKRNSTVKAK